MYWLEVAIVTGEQVAAGVAAAVEPFAYQETVVLEQLGDPHDLNPNAMLPYVTVGLAREDEEEDNKGLAEGLAEALVK